MSNNFRGEAVSDLQIADYAKRLRLHHGYSDTDVPDVIAALERKTIFTRFGPKEIEYVVVSDEELGGDEAITLVTEKKVRIRISSNTFDRACSLDRRARMTVAHEFGHAALHANKVALARPKQKIDDRIVDPFISVERQADVFASAYLITPKMIEGAQSAFDLSSIALVSTAAAEIRWEKFQHELQRSSIAAGLKSLSQELRTTQQNDLAVRTGMSRCPGCGERRLVPVGVRFLCTGTCDRPYDFSDGDGPV